MSEFKRENRYAVFKLKNLTTEHLQKLYEIHIDLEPEKQVKECVVVEHDWPNYDHVWQTVEQVATGAWREPPTNHHHLLELLQRFVGNDRVRDVAPYTCELADKPSQRHRSRNRMKYLINKKTKEHKAATAEDIRLIEHFGLNSDIFLLVEADSDGWIARTSNEWPLTYNEQEVYAVKAEAEARENKMTDRELLERAAKNAGIKYRKGDYVNGLDTDNGFWNPLESYTDCFLLAIDNGVQIYCNDDPVLAVCYKTGAAYYQPLTGTVTTKRAAVCRAVVRAVAGYETITDTTVLNVEVE